MKEHSPNFNGEEKANRRPNGQFGKGNNASGGRPHGSKNILSRKAAQKMADMGADPLEFLSNIMQDPEADLANRQRAAERLIEYAYSKQPTMTENKHDGVIPVMNVGVIPMEPEEKDSENSLQDEDDSAS